MGKQTTQERHKNEKKNLKVRKYIRNIYRKSSMKAPSQIPLKSLPFLVEDSS